MKRTICILLVMILVFGTCAGCGKKDNTVDNSVDQTESVETTKTDEETTEKNGSETDVENKTESKDNAVVNNDTTESTKESSSSTKSTTEKNSSKTTEEKKQTDKSSGTNSTSSKENKTTSSENKKESEKHKHSYSKSKTNPTCTEQGYTTYSCTCGDSYKGDYVSAKGHTEAIDKAVAATYSSTGLTEGKHCSECHIVLIAQENTPKRSAAENSVVTEFHLDGSEGIYYRTRSSSSNTLYNEWIIENVAIQKEDYMSGKFKVTVTITVKIINQVAGCPKNVSGEYLFVKDGKKCSGGGQFVKTSLEKGRSYEITFTEYGFEEGNYKVTFSGN